MKPLRRAVVLVTLLSLLITLTPFCAAQAAGPQAYVGRVGEFAIHMSLQRTGDDLSGWYYYDSRGIRLTIKGKVDGRYFRLAEYDENGINTGDFAGAFLPDGTLEGLWRDPDGKARHDFLAFAQDRAGTSIGYAFVPRKAPQIVRLYEQPNRRLSAEVKFTADQAYTVVIEEGKSVFNHLIKVYQGESLVFETDGHATYSFLTGARGDGKTDLVFFDVHGVGSNAGFITDFRIIGQTGEGIGLVALDLGKRGFGYFPKIVDSSDRIGIEVNQGGWLRYRIDVVWNAAAGRYELTEPVRITPPPIYPAADKTAYFSYGKNKALCFVGDEEVTELRLKVGQTLLLRSAPAADPEYGFYLRTGNTAELKVNYRGGYYLLTGLKPGTVKSGLQLGSQIWTRTDLDIIIEP